MGRVSRETIIKLNEFIDSLPEEARSKCALCNETLTHIVKMAEAQTGAGTLTVTRELSKRINDGAVSGDRVKGDNLRDRVIRHERPICANRTNTPEDPPDTYEEIGEPDETWTRRTVNAVTPNGTYLFNGEPTEAMSFATMAIKQLERIRLDDPKRVAALERVADFISKQM